MRGKLVNSHAYLTIQTLVCRLMRLNNKYLGRYVCQLSVFELPFLTPEIKTLSQDLHSLLYQEHLLVNFLPRHSIEPPTRILEFLLMNKKKLRSNSTQFPYFEHLILNI